MRLTRALASARPGLSGPLLAAVVAALVGCEDGPATGRPQPRPSAAGAAAPPSGSPAPSGSDQPATARSASTTAPGASSSASAPPQPSLPTRSVHCSAAGQEGPMFLGRLMRFTGTVAGVDGIGLLVHGKTAEGKLQLRRIAKDPPAEPNLKDEPNQQILVDDAALIFVGDKSVYYLEPQERPPFRSRLLYLPTSVDDPKPKALAEEATHIAGEWDGWLYVLKLRDEFDDDGLTTIESRTVRSGREFLDNGYRWRFRYDLLRVRTDGTSETIGQVPRDVDVAFRDHVYGRIHDWKNRQLGVFRAPVATGKQQVLYQRAWETGRGGVPDHIGNLAVEPDGIYFYDARYGVVRKMAHDGSASEEVVRRLAFTISLAAMGDYLFIDDRPRLKKGGTITYRNASDSLFGEDESGCGEITSSLRTGRLQFVAGTRSAEGYWYGDPWGFVYEYLPGGVVNARRFKLKLGHALLGPAADDECLYYIRTDYDNTWLYAMGRPAPSRSP